MLILKGIEMSHTKVFIIGSGPAGFTAAIYAARAGLDPVQALGVEVGGQLMTTTDVENYPGFEDAIQGPFLMDQMKKQAENVGTKTINAFVESVDTTSKPFKVSLDNGEVYTAATVIICTGAKARWLGIESEKKYQGFGVSACATCDGFFFRNKKVVVVGGGNTAVEEAIYMTNHASHVTLVHRRDQLRAENILQERLFNNPKISVIWDHVLEEVLGTESPTKSVNGVKLKNVKTGEVQEVEVEGVFIAIGHDPQTELFRSFLDTDAEGYLITKPESTQTNMEGIFAAGDVKDKIFRQAVTAAGQGCMAALEAQKYIQEKLDELEG